MTAASRTAQVSRLWCASLLLAAEGARADEPETATRIVASEPGQRPPVRRWFTVDDGQDTGILSLGAVSMNMALLNGVAVGVRADF